MALILVVEISHVYSFIFSMSLQIHSLFKILVTAAFYRKPVSVVSNIVL